MLTSLGYRVSAAPDAASALQLLSQLPRVDLFFTDVGLPNGVNGRQLADEVKKLRPDIAVLFTTGYARNAIVHHGRLDPAVELLLKTYTQLDLVRKLRVILRRTGKLGLLARCFSVKGEATSQGDPLSPRARRVSRNGARTPRHWRDSGLCRGPTR